MSALRTFALAAVAASALAVSGQAQGTTATPGSRPMAGQRGRGPGNGAGIYSDLDLTAAQKTQIQAIHAKYQAQIKASRDQAKPLMDAARAARQKGDTSAFRADIAKARQLSEGVRQQEMNEVRAILTPAQRAKADAAAAQRKSRGGMRGARGGRDQGGAFRDLNLTDAQKAQMKAIRAKYQGQSQTTRQQEMNEIRAVLTPEQRAQADSAMAQRKQERGNRANRAGRKGQRGRTGR
jgi:Spy/CpxP family protein refolding chaperone